MLILAAIFALPACSGEEKADEASADLENITALEEEYREVMALGSSDPAVRRQIQDLTSAYARFARNFPEHEKAPEYMFLAANLHVDALGDGNTASALLDELRINWPDHPQAERALFLKGYIHANELNRLHRARYYYQTFLETYPESDLRGLVEMELEFLGLSSEDILNRIQEEESE